VTIERVHPLFDADLDTRIEFQPEAIYLDRTLTLHEVKGEIFSTVVTLPAGEELLTVRRADDTEPDWDVRDGQLHLRWSTREAQTFRLHSRVEPTGWPQLGTDGLTFVPGDAKIGGARQITGYVALKASEGLRLEAEPSETLERRDGRTTPVQGDYAWFRRDDFALKVKVSRRPLEVLAALTGYALPLEGVLDLHAEIAYDFLRSGARSVQVKVPAVLAANFHFEGPQIAERNLAGDTWTIVFQKELTGHYALQITAQAPIEKAAGESRFAIDVPVITPLGVQRASGVWAVEANTETEITFTTASMNKHDSLLAPALAGYRPRHRVIGVFAWLGENYSLRLAGERHEAAPLASSVVDELNLDSVIGAGGVERHEARLKFRTSGTQYLDVTLPDGAKILSLTVDETRTKPVGGTTGAVRLTLPAKRDASQVIAISIVYEMRQREWRSGGACELRAPRFPASIPILRTEWKLYLPDGFEYTGMESNLRVPPAVPEPALLERFFILREPYALLEAARKETAAAPDFYAAPGGLVTEPPADMVGRAQEPEIQLSQRRGVPHTFAELADMSAALPPATPMEKPKTAGLLPMKMDLPKSGKVIALQGLAAPEKVSFHYEDWWCRARRLWMWLVAGGLACFVFAKRAPWWRTAWAMLVLTAWPFVISESATPVCNALLCGWLFALVIHRLTARFTLASQPREVIA
jgi:hypothetical protein